MGIGGAGGSGTVYWPHCARNRFFEWVVTFKAPRTAKTRKLPPAASQGKRFGLKMLVPGRTAPKKNRIRAADPKAPSTPFQSVPGQCQPQRFRFRTDMKTAEIA